jgi:1,2-diacylglycerol 3-alpha-glucosyltransferase
MKVALVFDNFGPYHLARLRAASQACTLLALQMNHRSRDYNWEPNSSPEGFRSATFNSAGVPRFFKGLMRDRWLRRALAEFAPDCVFVPGWSRGYSLECIRWCRTNSIPVVIMSETTEQDAARGFCKEWLKTRIVGRCAAALVGGAPHAEYLIKLGMATQRIFQGYDAVDNSYFAGKAQAARDHAAELRRKFDLPARYLLASARFIVKKNLPRLVRAFARYHRAATTSEVEKGEAPNNRSWSLVLLGDGALRPALVQLISQLGLEGFVRLPGFKQYAELPVYYGLADAFVHASSSEPWGLVVNEAMASGLPVLVSDHCGCAPDLVREGLNGFTFDPEDVEQLAQLMLDAWGRKSKSTMMGKASARIITNWGLDRFSKGFRLAAEMATGGHFSA